MANLNLRLHNAVKRVLNDVLRHVRLTLAPIMVLTFIVSEYCHQVESLERHPEHDSDVGIDIIAKEVVVHNSIPPLDVFIRVTVLVQHPIGVEVHVLCAVANEKFVEDF